MTDSLAAAGVLGILLGLQHATDADHLVAVGTIMTRERRFRDGMLIGLVWGLGHTAALGVAGGALLALGVAARVPSAGLEVLVAAVLVVLGASRVRESVAGMTRTTVEHLRHGHVADHDHGRLETIHRHPHRHDDAVHDHAHVHPSRRLASALAEPARMPLRPLVVGAVHGVAGSAAVALLALAAVESAAGVALYLALFGLGTVLGMTAVTAAIAYPLSFALRVERARHAIGVLAGLASIAFGAVYAYGAL